MYRFFPFDRSFSASLPNLTDAGTGSSSSISRSTSLEKLPKIVDATAILLNNSRPIRMKPNNEIAIQMPYQYLTEFLDVHDWYRFVSGGTFYFKRLLVTARSNHSDALKEKDKEINHFKERSEDFRSQLNNTSSQLESQAERHRTDLLRIRGMMQEHIDTEIESARLKFEAELARQREQMEMSHRIEIAQLTAEKKKIGGELAQAQADKKGLEDDLREFKIKFHQKSDEADNWKMSMDCNLAGLRALEIASGTEKGALVRCMEMKENAESETRNVKKQCDAEIEKNKSLHASMIEAKKNGLKAADLLKEKEAEWKAENDELKATIAKQNEEIAALKQKNETQKAKPKISKVERIARKWKREQRKAAFTGLDEKVTEFIKSGNEWNKAMEKWNLEKFELETDLGNERMKVGDLEAAIKVMEAEKTKVETDLKKTEEKLEAAAKASKTKEQELEGKLQTLNANLTTMERTIEQQKGTISSMKFEADRATQNMNEKENQWKTEFDTLKTREQELERDVKILNDSLAAKEATIREINEKAQIAANAAEEEKGRSDHENAVLVGKLWASYLVNNELVEKQKILEKVVDAFKKTAERQKTLADGEKTRADDLDQQVRSLTEEVRELKLEQSKDKEQLLDLTKQAELAENDAKDTEAAHDKEVQEWKDNAEQEKARADGLAEKLETLTLEATNHTTTPDELDELEASKTLKKELDDSRDEADVVAGGDDHDDQPDWEPSFPDFDQQQEDEIKNDQPSPVLLETDNSAEAVQNAENEDPQEELRRKEAAFELERSEWLEKEKKLNKKLEEKDRLLQQEEIGKQADQELIKDLSQKVNQHRVDKLDRSDCAPTQESLDAYQLNQKLKRLEQVVEDLNAEKDRIIRAHDRRFSQFQAFLDKENTANASNQPSGNALNDVNTAPPVQSNRGGLGKRKAAKENAPVVPKKKGGKKK